MLYWYDNNFDMFIAASLRSFGRHNKKSIGVQIARKAGKPGTLYTRMTYIP